MFTARLLEVESGPGVASDMRAPGPANFEHVL
jgi:hypothetical protein